MTNTLDRVRAHFAANGGYDLICREGVTVYTIANELYNGHVDDHLTTVRAIRTVLDELEPQE